MRRGLSCNSSTPTFPIAAERPPLGLNECSQGLKSFIHTAIHHWLRTGWYCRQLILAITTRPLSLERCCQPFEITPHTTQHVVVVVVAAAGGVSPRYRKLRRVRELKGELNRIVNFRALRTAEREGEEAAARNFEISSKKKNERKYNKRKKRISGQQRAGR